MSTQLNVADYVIQRLAKEGITDCFGVAGDYVFRMCDAVVRSKSVKWIGCSNELDAAYGADGYARVRGYSMLMTTYAVGELSALNGVMGANAERSCVFHLVGMQTMRHQSVHKITHHTLGDGVFQNFANISAQAACVWAVITPDNCVAEMERIIATARAESQILVASDYALVPVTPAAATAWPKPASGPELAAAIAAIAERIERAKSVAVLPAYAVGRYRLCGYMVERALEYDPNWEYNDLAQWNYHKLPAALGCENWSTAKVATLGELDQALARASQADTACYIAVVGGRTDDPSGLAMANKHLDAMYANG